MSKQEVILCEKLESSLASAIGNCPHDKLFILTDEHTHRLCLPQLNDIPALKEATEIIIGAEDVHKNLETLASVWQALSEQGATRHSLLINLGGGMVTDLGGFAASTFKRGIAYINIPTTLLAQVDSSVGGKVAVDLEHGKNLAGAFWQPRLVLMDPEVLDILPLPVFMEGMAEVVKYGCIRDAAFFDFLAARPSRAELMAEMEHILYTCCAIKRSVVEQDERDTGERMLLNFGHTLGHAYELAGGYETWSHGQAVAAGMCAAAELGVKLGVTPAEVPARLKETLAALDKYRRASKTDKEDEV